MLSVTQYWSLTIASVHGNSESQLGFMPRRSTIDVIFILRQTMETYRECQKNIRVTFTDLEKVYGRVPRKEIWRCMTERIVPEKYVRLIHDMHRCSQAKVRERTTFIFRSLFQIFVSSSVSPGRYYIGHYSLAIPIRELASLLQLPSADSSDP